MDTFIYNYRLLIMYEGTPFKGWQIQPNGLSIQQKIQAALWIIIKEHVHLIGSGRTDAGVHALGQTANFKTNQPLNLYRVQQSLNGLLPKEIRIMEIDLVDLNFHARYSAKRKTYQYRLSTGRYQDPFHRLYAWHFPEPIEFSRLEKAAAMLVGTHDFTSFANEAHAGSASRDPVRTLYHVDASAEGREITLRFTGDGFLYKMVRNMVGTLVDIAAGKLTVEAIPSILAAKDRRQAGHAAPAHGLFLVNVEYE